MLIETREAALTQFRIGDPAALLLHPRSPESGICPQQPLVLFAFRYAFCCADREFDTSPGLAIGACFTVTVCRCAWAWAAGPTAIAAKQTAAIAKIVAVLITIPVLHPATDIGV